MEGALSLRPAYAHGKAQVHEIPPPAFLALATLSQCGASFTQQGVVVLGVFFAVTYHLSLSQMALVVSSISTGWMIAGIFIGMLVDRHGPRAMLLLASAGMCGMAALLGWATSLPLTCVLLFALGLCLAVVPVAGSKAVLLRWDVVRRGLPMGIRQTGVPLGAMLAAFTLPRAASAIGIHPLFWGFAAILLITSVAFGRAISPISLPRTSGRAVHGTQIAALRRSALAAACGLLLASSQYDLLTYSIPMLHADDGLAITTAGVVLGLSQLGGGTARIVFGALSDRLGGRRDRVLLGVVGAAALLSLSLVFLPARVPLALLAPLWLCLGMGMVGWNALLMTWAGERVPTRHAGLAMSMMGSAVMFGGVVAPPLFGLVVEKTGSFHAGWLLVTGALVAAFALVAVAMRREARGPLLGTRERIVT